MNVFISTFGWTPEYRGRGSLFHWGMGEVVTLRSRSDHNKTAQVQIDSGLLKHTDAPGNGLVYEVVFLDGSGRYAVSADQLEPSMESITEIEAGRLSLGLSSQSSARQP